MPSNKFMLWDASSWCIRLLAISKYSGIFSMPIYLCPVFAAATHVVPEPANGSNIIASRGTILQSFSISGVGLPAIWYLSVCLTCSSMQPGKGPFSCTKQWPFVPQTINSHWWRKYPLCGALLPGPLFHATTPRHDMPPT